MKIPVVFAFDENYALPASVAIASLVASCGPKTNYEVIVLHESLPKAVRKKIETICRVRWVGMDARVFADAPVVHWGRLTYYRLLMARCLPEYERVIWSDVDVLFKEDLSEVFQADLSGAAWGGVVAECSNCPNGHHAHWGNNPCVHMPGFMVADLARWRAEGLTEKFLEVIRSRPGELKMQDLDVLNLSCSPIAVLPLEYCVLENLRYEEHVRDTREWPWLSSFYSEEDLVRARDAARIVHYAGGRSPKVWLRQLDNIPAEYRVYLEASPFFNREYYRPGWKTSVRLCWHRFVSHFLLTGKLRRAYRETHRPVSAQVCDPGRRVIKDWTVRAEDLV